MKILAKVMNGCKIDKIEVKHDLGIEIEHNNEFYTLSVDNFDKLTLAALSGSSLIIRPESSNRVELKQE